MTISTQSFISINIGTTANDGTGDDLRTAFSKVNDNFQWMGNTGFSAGNIAVNGSITLNGALAPNSNSSVGTVGQIVWDSGNIYVCVATNTWKRAALTSTF